jgi:catechol 2,3-dioxygenase-like lactoylglutathione lyase family enzyme
MIGYVTLGTNDFDRAASFYDALMERLGGKRVFESDRVVHWGKPGRPGAVAITKPYDGEPATVGNGVMVALGTRSKEIVHEVYELALSLGAADEGAPGLRTGDFYGAYFRDPDGNKLCVFTMVRPAGS